MVNDTYTHTYVMELMKPWMYNAAAAFLGGVQIIGLPLNLFVILLMCLDAKIWSPISIVIFNLTCCDFLVSLLGNPIALTSALSHRWMFGELGCTIYGFLMAFLGINSIVSIAVMSFERYLMVNCAFSTYKLDNRGAIYFVIFTWLYAFIVTCPPLFGWGAYVSEAANISCSVNWEERSARGYINYLFILGLIAPLIVIVYCYIAILIAIKASALRVNRTSDADKKVAKMVFIVFVAFMFAWSPYAIFSFCKQYGNPDFITPAMGILPSLFAKASICYNPIIYVGLNAQFRQAFDRLRGVRPPTVKVMTVSTIANVLDADARQAMRNKLGIANNEQREDNFGEVENGFEESENGFEESENGFEESENGCEESEKLEMPERKKYVARRVQIQE